MAKERQTNYTGWVRDLRKRYESRVKSFWTGILKLSDEHRAVLKSDSNLVEAILGVRSMTFFRLDDFDIEDAPNYPDAVPFMPDIHEGMTRTPPLYDKPFDAIGDTPPDCALQAVATAGANLWRLGGTKVGDKYPWRKVTASITGDEIETNVKDMDSAGLFSVTDPLAGKMRMSVTFDALDIGMLLFGAPSRIELRGENKPIVIRSFDGRVVSILFVDTTD